LAIFLRRQDLPTKVEKLKDEHRLVSSYSRWLATYQLVTGQAGAKIELP
jgi:hypothetical protein